MLDRLGSLGSIKAPSGTLEFGQVGSTACVFLRFVGGTGAPPCLVYTPEELASLIAMLVTAEGLAHSSRPGDIVRLGAMRPKPIVLRLALIHPANGSPFVLLRLLSGKGKLDIPVLIPAALELFRRGEIGSASPPVSGPLRRTASGGWTVGGRELNVVAGQSPGQGYAREYLHPDEVTDGEQLLVWPFSVGGVEYVGAFQTLNQWRPASQVNEPKAQEGDMALLNGQTYRCRQLHKAFARNLAAKGEIEPIWAAKLALSSLLCDIVDGEDESGHATWIGNSSDPVLQAGITAIEQGQASLHDQAIYQQVSCYFHSLGADQDSAAHAVNTILERLFAHFAETDPQQRRLLLANWAIHLKDIYDGKPPNDASESWKRAKAQYPGRVMPKAICFPPPDSWVLDWSEVTVSEDVVAPTAPTVSAAAEDEETATETLSPFAAVAAEESPGVAMDGAASESAETPPDAATKSAPAARPKPSGSRLPLVAGGLLCVGLVAGVGYKLFAQGPAQAQASPTPTVAAVATPQPSATPPLSATPQANASPSATPALVATASPSGSSEVVVGDLSSLGKITIGGIDPDGKYYVDRPVEGMTVLESGPDWARYDKDGTQIFMGAKQSGTRKGSRASAFASDALYSDGKKVLTAGATRDQIPAAAMERLKNMRIQVVVDPATDTILGFSTGEFPETTLRLGQPLGAALYKAFEERNLEAFKAGLTPETANLTFMDGETLLSKVARQAGAADYCQAMIQAGADVQGQVGIQALWATADPAIAKMLTAAGLAPDEPGPGGRTKLFGAGPEMSRTLLAAGGNPNAQDEVGASPLFATSDPQTIAVLIEAGANPNLLDKDQRSALMGANLEKTKALLAHGADPGLKDKDGRTAADYAGPDTAIVEQLKKGAKPAQKTVKPSPPTSSPTPVKSAN